MPLLSRPAVCPCVVFLIVWIAYPLVVVSQHIYTNGDICLSLLSARDWKPNLTVM